MSDVDAHDIPTLRSAECAIQYLSCPPYCLLGLLMSLSLGHVLSFAKDHLRFPPSVPRRVYLGPQCDQIWRNFANFGENLNVFGNLMSVYLVFSKVCYRLW